VVIFYFYTWVTIIIIIVVSPVFCFNNKNEEGDDDEDSAKGVGGLFKRKTSSSSSNKKKKNGGKDKRISQQRKTELSGMGLDVGYEYDHSDDEHGTKKKKKDEGLDGEDGGAGGDDDDKPPFKVWLLASLLHYFVYDPLAIRQVRVGTHTHKAFPSLFLSFSYFLYSAPIQFLSNIAPSKSHLLLLLLRQQ
jgi:hypothetical protein